VELNDPATEPPLLGFSRRSGIPVVATNDVHFVDPQEFALHRLLRAIDLNTCLTRIPPAELASSDRWLKSPEEMTRRYPHLPHAIANAEKIAAECSPDIDLGKVVFPAFETPDGSDAFEYLREECYRGAEYRYGELSESVVRRLEHELKIIQDKGFAPYFLVVQDIVRQSPRTCGRGSAAPAWCLTASESRTSNRLRTTSFLNVSSTKGARIRPTSTSTFPGTSATTCWTTSSKSTASTAPR